MALIIHVTLALALVSTSVAVRDQDPSGIKSLKGVAICGNDDIWKDITSPTTVRAIKAIDWKGIDDTMMDYLDDHKSLVASSDREIELLKEKIRQKKKHRPRHVQSRQKKCRNWWWSPWKTPPLLEAKLPQ
jgi:hypothetical protein